MQSECRLVEFTPPVPGVGFTAPQWLIALGEMGRSHRIDGIPDRKKIVYLLLCVRPRWREVLFIAIVGCFVDDCQLFVMDRDDLNGNRRNQVYLDVLLPLR